MKHHNAIELVGFPSCFGKGIAANVRHLFGDLNVVHAGAAIESLAHNVYIANGIFDLKAAESGATSKGIGFDDTHRDGKHEVASQTSAALERFGIYSLQRRRKHKFAS